MKVYAKPDAAADARRALVLASSLKAAWFVLADPADHEMPIVREQLDAEAEVKALHARLVREQPPSVVLARLRDWCADRRMPLLDAMRLRNGLTETFGEQCVRESVERELAGSLSV